MFILKFDSYDLFETLLMVQNFECNYFLHLHNFKTIPKAIKFKLGNFVFLNDLICTNLLFTKYSRSFYLMIKLTSLDNQCDLEIKEKLYDCHLLINNLST